MANKLLLTLALTAIASLSSAQSAVPDVKPDGPLAASMGIDQKFGNQVPLDASFKDENGKTVTIKDALQGRPAVLLPMFFGCNGVCRLEVEDLFKTFEKSPTKLQVGQDFRVVLLSINPTETPDFAKSKKTKILNAYNVPGGNAGIVTLVGNMDQIRRVTDSVGFRFTYNDATQAINHPAGLMFLDKGGVVRGYIYGAEYPTNVVVSNLESAKRQVKGSEPELVLLGCVMVDPVTGKRTIVIQNLMKVLGSAFALCVFGSIAYMSVKYRVAPIRVIKLSGSPAPDQNGGKSSGA